MKTNNKRSSSQAGFTLIEIMVGLTIGLLATLVIVQVMSVFENQKRVTTGTADAQINGTIALYDITREIQQAGYSMMPVSDTSTPLNCTATSFDNTGITNISPISIIDGGPTGNDSILIRYGSSPYGGIASTITANIGSTVTLGPAPGNNFGCQPGDVTLITNGANCAMSTVTTLTGTTQVTLHDASQVINGAFLACLGTWIESTYSVAGEDLIKTDFQKAPAPLVAGIVNLQAQYGISATTQSNQVIKWVDAVGIWANPTVANRNLIKAVRIAIVARNEKMESVDVTTPCSSTVGLAPSGLCAWEGSATSPAPTIDLSGTNANWKRYRYRVFDTTVPLRNMIFSRSTL